jgi:hypothetical protein
MTVAELQKYKLRLGPWAKIVPAVVALALLSGCVVVPAYGPGYYRGYYAPGYYYPYYYQNDYYRRY